MTLEEFRASLSGREPPRVAPALRALWHDAHGDWDAAHSVAQDVDDESGAWVHAYLHRIEGDLDNAAYWYRQARRKAATGELSAEWDEIVAALLQDRR